MSRSSRHREKNGHSDRLTHDNYDDETSARTRPLSYDEVMLRRNSRKDSARDDVVPEEPHVMSKGTALEESQKAKTRKKEQGSGKEDRLVRNAGDECKNTGPARPVIRSKIVSNGNTLERKNERIAHTDRGKDEYSRDDLKTKRDKRHSENLVKNHRSGERIVGKYEEHKSHQRAGGDEGQLLSRRKKDDKLRNDLENISHRRDSKDLSGAHKYADKSRVKSEKETKRKHQIDEERVKETQRSIKPDTGKRKYTDSPERKGKDSARNHHEESMSKKKRPRSREPDKDIVGRHSSQNMHKGTSHNIQENRNSAAYSSKDIPGGLHLDTENRTPTNGTSSHYRKHGATSSGLGGYSPRKRKGDSATRTPSPLRRSPEKRTIGWDLNPTGKSSINTGGLAPVHSEPSSKQDLPSLVSATLPTAKPPVGISDNTRPLNIGAVDSIQLTQATRPMRRLYVENLPASASEKDVMEWVNSSLLFSGVNHIQGTQPCISCLMNNEKGHALLEFLTPEVASTAISLDGRSFAGSILKLRRPKDFTHVFTGDMEKSVESGDSISDTVVDSPNKIFIGGISKIISSEVIKEIAQVFGPLKSYHFELNSDTKESYAFLEYVDHSITLKACAALNGMKLGGQILTVVQTIRDDSERANAECQPSYGIPENAKPLLQRSTQVLKLKNLFNSEGLASLSEAEVKGVLEDARIECSRFGTVKSVNYVKDNNSNTSRGSNLIDSGSSAERHSVEESDGDPSKSAKADKSEPQCCDEALVVDIRISESGNSDAEPSNPDISSNRRLEPEGSSDYAVSDIHTVEQLTDEMSVRTHDDTRNQEAAAPSWSENCGEIVDSLTVEDHEIGKMSSVEEDEQMGKLGKGDDCGEEGVFEPGCVLVEFKREEACREAAHCLQGRLFEDRVVAVEFIDLDVYHRRFPNTV